MSTYENEAINAVSASLANAEGDILAAIHLAEEKWRADLEEAKGTARDLLATVLAEREALRMSLGTAAELWRTLRPSELCLSAPSERRRKGCVERGSSFLTDEQQLFSVKSLQDVSHTLLLTEFIVSVPDALQRAICSLQRISEDGLDQVVVGNAASLVESHAILTAVERLKDSLLLEVHGDAGFEVSSLQNFARANETRALLESIVFDGIFSHIIDVSQQNPRLLVAAARVVENEEREDRWWQGYLKRYDSLIPDASIRSGDGKLYKQRAIDAIVKSLQAQFQKKELDLGLRGRMKTPGEAGATTAAYSDDSHSVNLDEILHWIEYRRSENQIVRRFVVPCLPQSFAVVELFDGELHRQFMRIITLVLHLATPDGSMLLSESDLIQLTSWYSRYKEEVGDHDEDINSFLAEEDRSRLIAALQKQLASRAGSKISSALASDRREFTASYAALDDTRKRRVGKREQKPVPRRTDLPDIVLGCVNVEVRRLLPLKIKGLDEAIAHTAAQCLGQFQAKVQQAVSTMSIADGQDSNHIYVCTTANNMARCLELSENLRGVFIPLASAEEPNQSGVDNTIDSVIEGFRSTSSVALQVLVDGMTSSLRPLAGRFFAPHTGTEIMLDIVATLDDHFAEYEKHLMDYHFEHLALECLKRVIICYLAPFMKLSNRKHEENAARRFASLPIFEEMNLGGTPSGLQEDGFFTLRSDSDNRNDNHKSPKGKGLGGMNSAAVVAQIDKDILNLSNFMEEKVQLFQRKQLLATMEPLQKLRAMYTCSTNTFSLSEAFREASIAIGRAMRPGWVVDLNLEGRFNAKVAEVIWECRADVNPVVRLEAANIIRSTEERVDSTGQRQSRMSSYDDGRAWGSRNSDFSASISGRLSRKGTKTYDNSGSSSSLLWAPSVSRNSGSRRSGH